MTDHATLLRQVRAYTSMRQRVMRTAALDYRAYWARVSPRLTYPDWLAPMTDVLMRAERALVDPDEEPVRACISVPPQHGKTTNERHWLARLVARHPHLRHIFASYGAALARPMSASIRDQVSRVGVPLKSTLASDWVTSDNGGIVSCGVPGPISGRACDGIANLDDPIRGRQDADSAAIRNRVWGWYTGDLFTRTHDRTSIVVTATRWHPDDLTGRLTSGKHGAAYELSNLPALDDDDNPLCPQLHSRERLHEARRLDEWNFESLYLGRPTPRGAPLFVAPWTIASSDMPVGPRQTKIGLDFAYTESTRADWSTAVVLQRFMDDPRTVYVVHVERDRVEPEEWARRLVRLGHRYPSASWAFRGSTTEIGQARMIRGFGGPHIETELARGDKYSRAVRTAAAWNNDGVLDTNPRVIVVSDRPWFPAFASEAQDFTGRDGGTDDQIDALGSAFDALFDAPEGVAVSGGARHSHGFRSHY